MPQDMNKSQQVSDSFNQDTGVEGLKKMYGNAKAAMMTAMQNRKGMQTDTTTPDTTGAN